MSKSWDRGVPAVVLITGQTGMGKTTFLREVARQARTAGWRVALGTDETALSVSVKSSKDSFARELLKLKEGDPGHDTLLTEEIDAHIPDASLVAQLACLGRLLVLVDGYRPNQIFHEWFMGSFLANAKESKAPLVVAVADTSEKVATLKRYVDEEIILDTLKRSALRAHFGQIGRRLDPPMSDSEEAHYVDATLKRLDLVGSLTRVLALAASPGGETSHAV